MSWSERILYDCDDYTRSYYLETYGVKLSDAVDCSIDYGISQNQELLAFRLTSTTCFCSSYRRCFYWKRARFFSDKRTGPKKKDVLRFLLRLAPPCSVVERQRRFTLTYYTDTDDAMVFESPVRNSGFVGGCFCSRRRLPKQGGDAEAYYTISDFSVGGFIVVNGHKFEVMNMDEHTRNYLAGKNDPVMNDEKLHLLISAFRLFLGTRFSLI
ncbi:hypothetical protein TcBrA4_0112900 [Trypanosoma cruzi]|nr:hypothetical protein TcBrA4_0112900 [Trypanosoma cruzi]